MTGRQLLRPEAAVRVVLVDDTPDIRLLMGLALDLDAGFTVVGEAADGVEALEVVAATGPDLILLDLAMPRLDGLAVIPRLRAMCPEATILVLSGFDGAVLGPRSVAAGADDYLRKGTSPQDIVSAARGLRSRRQVVPRSGPASGSVDLPGEPEPPWSVSADWLQSAPFGLVTVRVGRGDDDELWVGSVNEAARVALDLDDTPLPAPLARISPALDALIRSGAGTGSDHAGEETLWPGEPSGSREDLAVRLHRAGDVVTAVLMPVGASAGEAGRLRRAIASVAHELRNPVTVLVGATQALTSARGRLAPDMEDRLLGAIDRQARLLERATTDLLTAVQRHSGTFEVRLEPMPLAPALTRCVATMTGLDQVDVDCEDDLWICADRDRLEQIVVNLVSNAVKYGEAPVALAVTSTDDTVAIEVSDGGVGVPAGFIPRMFDEFTRAGQHSVPGTGLGLHVVRTLAEAHHGTVSYARTPGQRTLFSVTLPRVAAPRRRADDEARP